MKNVIIIIALLSTFFITSCNSKNNKDNESTTKHIIQLSLVTQDTIGSPYDKGYNAFAIKLSELSGGTMTVSISQLMNMGTISDMFNAICEGTVDIVTLGYCDKSNIIPKVRIIGEAYVISDYEHLLKVLDSDYGKEMEEKYNELGVITSSVWYAGLRQVTSNKPINSFADFSGLRFRAAPADISISFAENMATIVTPIKFSELYDALESNEVEAQENPLSIIEARRLHRVQNYLALTDHIVSTTAVFINKDKYESFTSEQKAWYDEAIEYGKEVCNTIVYEEEATLLNKFETEYGMTITRPNKDELRNAMKPHYNKLEEQFGNGSVYSLIEME